METDPRRGLFLDLDGTLADSLSALKTAYYQFMQSKGLDGSEQEFLEFNGPPIREIVVVIQRRYGLAQPVNELTDEYFRTIGQVYNTIPPSDGAGELLRFATQSGWICGVVTSNSEKIVKEWLDRVELGGLIHRVIGAESVANGKPSPDPYLKALEALTCAPELSIAVEDSEKGLASARAAGLRAFSYCHPHNSVAPVHLDQFEKISCLAELIPILSVMGQK